MKFLTGSKWSCLIGKPLLVCALLSSLAWFVFWVVMAPVEQDVNHLVNWYFFIKLKLDKMYDIYGLLALIHYWIPLFAMCMALLSTCSPILTALLETVAQVTFALITVYNIIILLYMLFAGGIITSLFLLTLPLRLALSLGPWLAALFLPHKIFIPVLFLVVGQFAYSYMCSSQPSARNRIRTLSENFLLHLLKRIAIIFGVPCLIVILSMLIMKTGCEPCSSNNSYNFKKPPPRPKLIAHRGCGGIAPENSVVAYERAATFSTIIALETDVQISLDGVPFLLHDPYLTRTTDIRNKCPHVDPFLNASLLNYSTGICPLEKLNIGAWFVKESGGSVHSDNLAAYSGQTIPTLSEFLLIAQQHEKIIIFDVMELPIGHPHYSRHLNITLEHIVQSKIDLSKVWWLAKQNRQWVINNFPDIVQITKTKETKFEDFPSEHIQRINDDWTTHLDTFRKYQAVNISINMYFVESVFMYEYAWCLGAESVTTNNCQQLSEANMNHLFEVCSDWYTELISPSSVSWWTGLTALLLLFITVLLWDKLPAQVKR